MDTFVIESRTIGFCVTMEEKKMKDNLTFEPIIMAISLNRNDATEHIIVGEKTQVYSRMNGNMESRVLYDEVRKVGEFIFEHEKQLDKDWNAAVFYPLREALFYPVRRAKNESAAWRYLEAKESCGDPISIFTAACCRSWYAECKTALGSRSKGKEFESKVMRLTRSFKQVIGDEKQERTIEELLEVLEISTDVYTTASEMLTTIQYPTKKCDKKYLIIERSFYPAIWYYMDHLREWEFCLCKCVNCGKMFFQKNMRFHLCSEDCVKANMRKAKREYDSRARNEKQNGICKNAIQRMKNRLNRTCRKEGVSEEQIRELKEFVDSICAEARRQKKMVKTPEDCVAFENQLFVWERKVEARCEEVERSAGVEMV